MKKCAFKMCLKKEILERSYQRKIEMSCQNNNELLTTLCLIEINLAVFALLKTSNNVLEAILKMDFYC